MRGRVTHSPRLVSEVEQIAAARVLVTEGKPDASLELLARLLPPAETAGRMKSVNKILALQALALQAQGNRGQALSALERALSLAEPEGFVRTFVDEGIQMARLLKPDGHVLCGERRRAKRLGTSAPSHDDPVDHAVVVCRPVAERGHVNTPQWRPVRPAYIDVRRRA